MNAELAKKATITALNSKADTSTMNAELAKKVDLSAIDAKANIDAVNAEFATKATTQQLAAVSVELATKASTTALNAKIITLETKLDASEARFTALDTTIAQLRADMQEEMILNEGIRQRKAAAATGTKFDVMATITLKVNDKCDPLADVCDKAKNLVCSSDVYECRYGTSTTTITSVEDSSTPAPTTTTASVEESGEEKKSNVRAVNVVVGVVGGLVFLVILSVVVHRWTRKDLGEVRARTRQPRTRNQQPGVPYRTTTQNPTYDRASQEANYAEILEESAYVQADPNRPEFYDKGHLAGARDHALRVKRLSQQLDGDDLDI
jgi:hypothetical protein